MYYRWMHIYNFGVWRGAVCGGNAVPVPAVGTYTLGVAEYREVYGGRRVSKPVTAPIGSG